MTKVETICLFSRKSLILGNKVEKEDYKPQPTDMARFGLFDSSAPNYVQYDSSVSKDDFTPKDEDFIYPKFRLLSNTIVHERSWPIDFSDGTVLKDSIGLLEGTAVYPDHEASIGNSFGVIEKLEWEEGYELDGVKVPPGITATLKLDAKANPRIARLLLMSPPAINSTSVTVQFAWKKSHDVDDNEFYSKLGSFDKNGEQYRRVVTKIWGYPEVSLVTMGADKFAQKIGDKGIVNPNKANEKFHYFNVLDYTNPDNAYNSLSINTQTNRNIMTDHKKLSDSLVELGVDVSKVNFEELSFESLAELIEGIKAPKLPDNIIRLHEEMPELDLEQVQSLQANQVTEVQASVLKEIPDMEAFNALKARAEMGDQHVSQLRDKTIANYKLTVGAGNESEAVIKLLTNADLDSLTDLNKGYETTLNALTPLACQDCGSLKVERKSTKVKPNPDNESTQELEARIRKSRSQKPSTIHKA